jgi:hypothetical protein
MQSRNWARGLRGSALQTAGSVTSPDASSNSRHQPTSDNAPPYSLILIRVDNSSIPDTYSLFDASNHGVATVFPAPFPKDPARSSFLLTSWTTAAEAAFAQPTSCDVAPGAASEIPQLAHCCQVRDRYLWKSWQRHGQQRGRCWKQVCPDPGQRHQTDSSSAALFVFEASR